MAFKTESQMVETIKTSEYFANITKPGPSVVKEEVKGVFGIPDLVVLKKNSKNLISYAFEAKLSNWKRAHFQAFRYKAFANMSYVILDNDHVSSALKNIEIFERSNIGLISIDYSGSVFNHYQPYVETPFSPQLVLKFQKKVFE